MTNRDPHFSRDVAAESSAEAAAWLGPEHRSSKNDDVTNDIAAELADHLAESTAAARVKGLNEDQAKAHAATRFGDVAAILRQCWWIKKGDAIMFRSAAIILGCICVIGLFAVAYSTWQIEASFTDQMGTLSGQLAELNQTLANSNAPAAPPASTDSRPQITGKLYLGDPSIPAVGADVEVRDLKTKEVVRQMRTDERGNYASGPLDDGEYFVLASLVGRHNPPINSARRIGGNLDVTPEIRPKFVIQSQPVVLWKSKEDIAFNLDVQFQVGQVSLEINRPIGNADPIDIALLTDVYSKSFQGLPWSRSQTEPATWPLLGLIGGSWVGRVYPLNHFENAGESLEFFYGIDHDVPWTPADEYEIKSVVAPAVFRLDRSAIGGDASGSLSRRVLDLLSHVFNSSDDESMKEFPELNPLPTIYRFHPEAPFTFEVRPNQRTRLRLVIPDGYEDALNAAISREEWDKEEIIREFTPRPIQIELIGYEPIEAGE